MVWRSFVRYTLQGLLLFAPFVTVGKFGLLDLTGIGKLDEAQKYVVLGLVSYDSQERAQLEVGVLLTLLCFVGISLAEASDAYFPRKRLEEYQTAYFDEEWATRWKKKIGIQGARVNIMYVRRRWYTLFLPLRLVWVWGAGYRANTNQHEDDGVCFFWFQGACGKAFRKRQPQLAQIPVKPTRFGKDGFWLFARQRRKTASVRAVLSIPILAEALFSKKRMRCVGVLNIDVRSADGARDLENKHESLIEYFGKRGKILAILRT